MHTQYRLAFRADCQQHYPVEYEQLSDLLEIGEAQLRSVSEIAPKSTFLGVNRNPIRYEFCAQKLCG